MLQLTVQKGMSSEYSSTDNGRPTASISWSKFHADRSRDNLGTLQEF